MFAVVWDPSLNIGEYPLLLLNCKIASESLVVVYVAIAR